MTDNENPDTDQRSMQEQTNEDTTRRKFMHAGVTGAAMFGMMGVSGATKPKGGQSPHSGANTGWGGINLPRDGDLTMLLRRNQLWTDVLPDGYFSDVQDSQAPTVTSVCCSDSRVSQEGMFLAFSEAGFLFKPSNIGNKVISLVDGERVVNGNFLYGLENTDSEIGAVVGHTDCGAITAAYKIATGQDLNEPPGIDQELEVLVDIVREGLQADFVDTDTSESAIVNQLVEYNVNRQVEFLVESDVVSDDRDLYGFIYDFQGAYAETRGKTYLVNINGQTDQDALRAQVSNKYESFVESLLRS